MILVTATQSLAANEGVFFNLSSARKLAIDIDYYKSSKGNDTLLINTLKESNNKYLALSTEHTNKILLLEKDKVILKTRGDKFEEDFTSCSVNLVKCKDDQTSKLTWFGVGFGSALLIIIVGLFATK